MGLVENGKSAQIDLAHTFQIDESFEHLQKPENAESKFFCEVFSLMDAMRYTSTLHRFSQKVKEQKGSIKCCQILQVIKDENLMNKNGSLTRGEDDGLQHLLDSIYEVVKKIVLDGYVSCMHSSTLGCRAWEAGQLYLGKAEKDKKEQNNNESSKEREKLKKGLIWVDLAERLQELAEYQRKHKKIHHDFQKSNYAPNPKAKYVYGITFIVIILSFVFMILTSCKTETKGFLKLSKG